MKVKLTQITTVRLDKDQDLVISDTHGVELCRFTSLSVPVDLTVGIDVEKRVIAIVEREDM